VDTLAAKEASDVETLTGRLDTAASDIRSVQISVRDNTASIGTLNVTASRLSSDVEALTLSVRASTSAIETLQAATGTISNDLGAVTDLATATSATTAANTEAITGIRDAITQMRASITANAAAINAFNAAITELTSTQNVDRATLTARIQAAENSVTALSQTVDAMNTTLSNQISGLRADMTVNSQDIAVIKSTLQTQGAAIASAEDRCTAVESRMNAQEVGMATLRQQLLNSVMNIENEIEQVVTDKAAIKKDLNDLTEAINDYEAVTNATLQEHNYRIARLEGGDPARINSFTASPDICEMGGSENIILSWDIYGDVDMITINGEPVTGTSKTYANVREDTTYNLSVKDTKGNTLNSSVSVVFVNHLFWGVSNSPNQTEGTVKALDYTEMSDTRTRTIHVSPSNEYIYYAYPKRLGTSEFRVNGFTGGFENPVTVAIDNHSGYTED
jgi:predicted  nucleic acid-binding Zn-ribbon protein